MWRVHPGPIAAVMIACATATTTATESPSTCQNVAERRQQLRVLIVPGTVAPAVLETIRAEVIAIWRDYQVDVVWEEPGPEVSPDLWVQFVDGRLPAERRGGPFVIGSHQFESGFPTGRIKMSSVAAATLLGSTSWAPNQPLVRAPASLRSAALGRILGRALAHEIGHFLLASTSHADWGLMRVLIPPDDLVSVSRTRLRLSDANVRALRAVLVARCEGAR